MRLEYCHWLHTNRQFLPLVLFTDEATVSVTKSTTRVTHIDGLTTIHMVRWNKTFIVLSL